MENINLNNILQFLRNKMQDAKNATYDVKVRQYNYSHYSSIRRVVIDEWDFSKEFLHEQGDKINSQFEKLEIEELIKLFKNEN